MHYLLGVQNETFFTFPAFCRSRNRGTSELCRHRNDKSPRHGVRFLRKFHREKMRANKATADVYVNLENKIVAVSEKAGQKLDDGVLRAQIADAGYEVKAIERVSASISEIRAQNKAKKS
jgi:hypothetical protein